MLYLKQMLGTQRRKKQNKDTKNDHTQKEAKINQNEENHEVEAEENAKNHEVEADQFEEARAD